MKSARAQDHVPDLADDVERQNAPQLVLRGGPEDAGDHGKAGHPEQQLVRVPDVVPEDQREETHQRVDADLRQQAGEYGRNRGLRRVVAGRKPEEEREHRRLQAERD